MARTLVISNADFSVNKLDTVTLGGKECTSIALDKSTDSITSIGGTSTLTATVTPSDTTDAILWSSSDSEVVSVAGGVVTANKCGTATITASCGNYSAFCVVEVTHMVTGMTFLTDTYLGKDDNKDYLTGGTLEKRGIGFLTTGEKRISGSTGMSNRYPYPIPAGASKIEITTTELKPYGFWLSTTIGSSSSSSVAKAFVKDEFGTIPSEAGNRSVTIPDTTSGTYEGVNAVAFVFVHATAITQAMLEAVEITFTA